MIRRGSRDRQGVRRKTARQGQLCHSRFPGVAPGTLSLRYRLKERAHAWPSNPAASSVRKWILLAGKFEMLEVPFSPSASGKNELVLESEGGGESSSMVFYRFPRKTAKKSAALLPVKRNSHRDQTRRRKSLILKYDEGELLRASPGIFRVRGPGIFER